MMQQTPPHDGYNGDLLAVIPEDVGRLVEVGCSTGALARAYTAKYPSCEYIGIDVDPGYAATAKTWCSEVIAGDIETLDEDLFRGLFPSDCWVFGDCLEHLKEPWAVLRRIRAVLPQHACVVACIPNAQHWTVQARLNCGLLRYEQAGLLDRTHLRWFTRITIEELFVSTGFEITVCRPRVFKEPGREKILPAIRTMAEATGADPEVAMADAVPLQFIIRAMPV